MAINSVSKAGGLAQSLMKLLTGGSTGEKASGSSDPSKAEEAKKLAVLRAVDDRVRHHDVPQKIAANGNPDKVTYSYRMGSDGQRYAISAEVGTNPSSDTPVKTPLQKAQQELIDQQLGATENAGAGLLHIDIRI
ncbi:MAG: hypothetical protein GX444_08705 [Myxococcales bacterium]|nr:hypothetical protein [Myxococcales bacterium]